MDRTRPKSKARTIKRVALVVALVSVLITCCLALANIDFSSHRVDREKLSIATVQQGTMDIKVTANGQLLSERMEDLAAQAPGRVAKRNIKPGALVHVGQVLVELTNPDLISSEEEAQSAWEGAMAELQAAEAELQNNILAEESVLSQAQINLERAQLKAESDRVLNKDGLIADIEMKRSQLDVVEYKKTYDVQVSRIQKLRENVQSQLAVRKSRVTQLARALDRAKSQSGALKVVAGIDGIVQAINVEDGQQVQAGSPIGRIARQDKLYAELKVPAREATQARAGQNVVVDTRNGTVNGVITRIDPGVNEGTVVVDVELNGAMPAGARPQLEVEGIIYISQLRNTLYVGKPSYVKNDASIRVYKLDPDGRYATRVTIQVGRVSVNYLQVLQGLSLGDRIITSEIDAFQDQERILLK
jgi:HlyD family secretion protein